MQTKFQPRPICIECVGLGWGIRCFLVSLFVSFLFLSFFSLPFSSFLFAFPFLLLLTDTLATLREEQWDCTWRTSTGPASTSSTGAASSSPWALHTRHELIQNYVINHSFYMKLWYNVIFKTCPFGINDNGVGIQRSRQCSWFDQIVWCVVRCQSRSLQGMNK